MVCSSLVGPGPSSILGLFGPFGGSGRYKVPTLNGCARGGSSLAETGDAVNSTTIRMAGTRCETSGPYCCTSLAGKFQRLGMFILGTN